MSTPPQYVEVAFPEATDSHSTMPSGALQHGQDCSPMSRPPYLSRTVEEARYAAQQALRTAEEAQMRAENAQQYAQWARHEAAQLRQQADLAIAYARAVTAMRNGQVFIGRIPHELLLEILKAARTNLRADIRLMHVCHLWRSLLYGTTEFWTHLLCLPIRPGNPCEEQMIPLFLARSAPRPIKLHLTCHTLHLFRPILKDVTRIATLNIFFPHDGLPFQLDDFYDVLAANTRMLEVLGVTMSCSYAQEQDGKTLPAVEFPRLRILQINGSFSFNGIKAPALEHIVLTNCYDHAQNFDHACSRPTSLNGVMQVLKGFPKLHTLELKGTLPLDLAGFVAPNGLTMRRIEVYDSPLSAYVFLRLAFPPSVLVAVHADFNVLPVYDLEVIQLADNVVLDLAGTAPNTQAIVRAYVSGVERLNLTIPCTFNKGVEQLFSSIPPAFIRAKRVTRLELSVHPCTRLTQWTAVLETFPRLTFLKLSMLTCRTLFATLASHAELLPELLELDVSSFAPKDVEAIVLALEARASRGLRLKRLRLRRMGLDDWAPSAIAQNVGPDVEAKLKSFVDEFVLGGEGLPSQV